MKMLLWIAFLAVAQATSPPMGSGSAGDSGEPLGSCGLKHGENPVFLEACRLLGNGRETCESYPQCVYVPGSLVACTMEMVVCPDGSFVGRSGPQCTFNCAAIGPPPLCPADVRQCSDGTYVARQGLACNFPTCPFTTLDPPTDWCVRSPSQNCRMRCVAPQYNTNGTCQPNECRMRVDGCCQVECMPMNALACNSYQFASQAPASCTCGPGFYKTQDLWSKTWGCVVTDSSEEPLGCQNGDAIVPYGWRGAGTGLNWCNTCSCGVDGLLACSKMFCGDPHPRDPVAPGPCVCGQACAGVDSQGTAGQGMCYEDPQRRTYCGVPAPFERWAPPSCGAVIVN